MVEKNWITSLSELIREDVVEIDSFGFQVFAVSQITHLSEFRVDLGFSCLYFPDFPEDKMSCKVFHLDNLYDEKIRILDFENYVGWKYKTISGEIYLPKGL